MLGEWPRRPEPTEPTVVGWAGTDPLQLKADESSLGVPTQTEAYQDGYSGWYC